MEGRKKKSKLFHIISYTATQVHIQAHSLLVFSFLLYTRGKNYCKKSFSQKTTTKAVAVTNKHLGCTFSGEIIFFFFLFRGQIFHIQNISLSCGQHPIKSVSWYPASSNKRTEMRVCTPACKKYWDGSTFTKASFSLPSQKLKEKTVANNTTVWLLRDKGLQY